jgi:hypothetical protein
MVISYMHTKTLLLLTRTSYVLSARSLSFFLTSFRCHLYTGPPIVRHYPLVSPRLKMHRSNWPLHRGMTVFPGAVCCISPGLSPFQCQPSQRGILSQILQESYIDRAGTKKQPETKDESMQQSMVTDKESSNQQCWLQHEARWGKERYNCTGCQKRSRVPASPGLSLRWNAVMLCCGLFSVNDKNPMKGPESPSTVSRTKTVLP